MIPDFSDRSLIDLLSISGRGAVVTGGARGIGLAIAHRMAEAGADVLIADSDHDEATVAAARLTIVTGRRVIVTGRRVIAAMADVTDSDSLARAADRAVTEFGGLHIWVTTPASSPPPGQRSMPPTSSSIGCCRSTCAARSPGRERLPAT